MIQVQVHDILNIASTREVDQHPNQCPFCHQNITAQHKSSFMANEEIELVFRCPNITCGRIFVGYYQTKEDSNNVFLLQSISIGIAKGKHFSDIIKNVSSSFVEIYDQALEAEKMNLTHISGIGYRKALEFLIKDYLIEKNPEKEESVRKKVLGKTVEEDIDNPNLKEMAKRAIWLENDESPYMRKWLDRDINDLKILIDVTLRWIEMEKLTESYTRDTEEDTGAST